MARKLFSSPSAYPEQPSTEFSCQLHTKMTRNHGGSLCLCSRLEKEWQGEKERREWVVEGERYERDISYRLDLPP